MSVEIRATELEMDLFREDLEQKKVQDDYWGCE